MNIHEGMKLNLFNEISCVSRQKRKPFYPAAHGIRSFETNAYAMSLVTQAAAVWAEIYFGN